MPRPTKLEQEAKQKAWAVAHPKLDSMPDKLGVSGPITSVRALLGLIVVVGGSVFGYLSLAGVTDSMTAARLVLILTGILVFVGVLVSEGVWGKSLNEKIFWTSGTGIVLILSFWGLDAWTVKYRASHQTTQAPPVAFSDKNGSDNLIVGNLAVGGTFGLENTTHDLLLGNVSDLAGDASELEKRAGNTKAIEAWLTDFHNRRERDCSVLQGDIRQACVQDVTNFESLVRKIENDKAAILDLAAKMKKRVN